MLARNWPVGFGKSQRTFTVRVLSSAAVLIQETVPLISGSSFASVGWNSTVWPCDKYWASSWRTSSKSHIWRRSVTTNSSELISTISPATILQSTTTPSSGARSGNKFDVVEFSSNPLVSFAGSPRK